MQIQGELFFANQGRKMGVMPSIITILWTQSGGKRGSIESSFILSTFLVRKQGEIKKKNGLPCFEKIIR